MSLISVVIPVYNGEKTIRQTIESVINQTFSNFELIVIDDGSQDSTLDIVRSISDSRLKVFSFPNAGLATSRNRGIQLASGDYISFIDADDLWTGNKLEAQLKALLDNPQAAVAFSWTDCIDESGQFSRRGNYTTVSGNVYAQLLLTDFIENGSNLLIRSEAFKKVGYFNESLPAAEDWDMWLRLAVNYEFAVVPSPQVFYRLSTTSMSANVVRQEAACLQVIDQAFAQAPDSVQHLKKPSLANLYKYLTYKVLAGVPDPQAGKIAVRFWRQVLHHQPELWHKRVTWKVFLKSGLVTLLSARLTDNLIWGKWLNTDTILGYIKLNP
ncbi:glycosyl transferase, group 2 family protein [Coleofasciculus chthonoplastes PCC 7420]|uniref:Glycosyl transferase, group 2 family protein n=1 Tax=Coleofasciculus chthonoplastes PCC 7420 TaxID=118168 RepID=B4VMI0_9CYAN|nr:glycosyltransferase [Coleofasciculus chthonoplastes]EDX76939.1 glycosyl transferase, group 2 family protein [Coleofasciculus chthonoplastes PCC 7420]